MPTYGLGRCPTSVLWTLLLVLIAMPTAWSAPLVTPTPSFPQLFCIDNARIAWELLVFISTNYLLHAASIPVGADIGRYTERVTRKDAFWHKALVSLASLFMPFFALARTIILIAEQIECTGNDILAALHHGALLVVVRDFEKWKPCPEGEIIFTVLPEKFDHRSAQTTEEEAVIVFDEIEAREAYRRVNAADRLIHGVAQIPTGYTLAVPAHKEYTEAIIKEELRESTAPKIHHPPGIMNMLLSVFQIIFASFSLALSMKDQVHRWGYASYGLSVFPYALMSVMNLLCAGFVGGYACGQILRTPILEESLHPGRHEGSSKGVYDGLIGTLSEWRRTNIGDPGNLSSSRGQYVAVRMSTYTVPNLAPESATSDSLSQKRLTVEGVNDQGSNWTKTYRLVDFSEQHQAPTSPAIKRFQFTVSALSHRGPPPKEKLINPWQDITWLKVTTTTFLFLVVLIVPYAFIYAMTGFHPRQSTFWERAWMMAWLAADQLSSILVLVCWLIWKKKNEWIPTWVHYVWITLLTIPGVGGYVTVGRMFLAHARFGADNCRAA